MLTLLTFPGGFDQPSHSPYCVKAMCLLEMSGFEWRPEVLDNPSRMPHRRLPVLKTPDSLIPDSHQIQSYLESRGADFFPGLNGEGRAKAHMLVRMVEENLSKGIVHERWLNDRVWPICREEFFAKLPKPLRKPIASGLRRQVRAALWGHGIARLSEQERVDLLARDLDALSSVLNGKPFLFGNSPTAADAATVPVLEMLRTLPVATPIRDLVRARGNLLDYAARGRAAMYPTAGVAAAMAAE